MQTFIYYSCSVFYELLHPEAKKGNKSIQKITSRLKSVLTFDLSPTIKQNQQTVCDRPDKNI